MKRPKPHTLDEVDVELEQAIEAFRTCCQRVDHGRVHLVVERDRALTIGHRVDRDPLTTDDLERVMCERPHKEVKACRQ